MESASSSMNLQKDMYFPCGLTKGFAQCQQLAMTQEMTLLFTTRAFPELLLWNGHSHSRMGAVSSMSGLCDLCGCTHTLHAMNYLMVNITHHHVYSHS